MPEISSNTRGRSWWVNILLALSTIVLFVLIAGILLSPFVRIETAKGRHQLFAAVSVKILNRMQRDYAASHLSGFTCDLEQLKTVPSEDHGYEPSVGSYYRFSINECRADAKGQIKQYQITAAPQEHGNWAFCSDQSGVIWHDQSGSASKCLLERRNGFNPEEEEKKKEEK